MKSKIHGECLGCGNPDIIKGETHVRMKGNEVIACEVCDPNLVNEPDEPDPNAIRSITVKIVAQKYAKVDGSYYIYVVSYAGPKDAPGLPDGVKQPSFGLCGPVGNFKALDTVVATGRFKTHPQYGFQLEAVVAAYPEINSRIGLVTFLSRFPNVGPKRAMEILNSLGTIERFFEVLDSDDLTPLTAVEGITLDRAKQIQEEYQSQMHQREFRLFAAGIGLTEHIITQALNEWGEEAEMRIREDPFDMMDFERVGFKTCDEVRKKLGIGVADPKRCAAGVLAALAVSTDEGHTYLLEDEIYGRVQGRVAEEIRKIGLDMNFMEKGMEILERERRYYKKGKEVIQKPKIVRQIGRVYPRKLYEHEHSIASDVLRIQVGEIEPMTSFSSVWNEMNPDPAQVEALEMACKSPMMILTGGPGTGKTQTTKAIIDLFEAHGMDYSLCAPTGKAAKRLSELTERPASTIHRMLGYVGGDNKKRLEILEGDAFVVDEASMVDTELMSRFLDAIPTGARVIIVGDVDQLPSIGPGRVLHDLIDSGMIPVVRLTTIFRQVSDGESKRIPEVARDVNTGTMPDLYKKGTDVTFLPFDDVDLLQKKIVMAVDEQLPKKLGCTSDDIQVISPQKGKEEGHKNWAIGTRALNNALQAKLNPPIDDVEVEIGEKYKARARDRVIQCVNNYELQVMNGETGVVVRASKDKFDPPEEVITSYRAQKAAEADICAACGGKGEIKDAYEISSKCLACERRASKGKVPKEGWIVMMVDYSDGRIVGYTPDECKEMQLAYALTVHKCQGSQYKAVVIPVHTVHQWMLTRPLVYTAITRAEQYVLIIGQEYRFQQAIKNRRGTERRTSLVERLKAYENDDPPTPSVSVYA